MHRFHVASTAMLLLIASTIMYLSLAPRAKAVPNGEQPQVEPAFEIDYLNQTRLLSIFKDQTARVNFTLKINRQASGITADQAITLSFDLVTTAPHFPILSNKTSRDFIFLVIDNASEKSPDYEISSSIDLIANYIGHARLIPTLAVRRNVGLEEIFLTTNETLNVKITKEEGAAETIFSISVTLIILLTYVNMGTQLDIDSMKQLLKFPLTIFVGFTISIITMPVITWLVISHVLPNQGMYMIGAFVLATTPPASTASAWTAVLSSVGKELAVTIHILSCLASVATMPSLLYALEGTASRQDEIILNFEVPYVKLTRSLILILLALLFGWLVVGKSKLAKRIATKIYMPLMLMMVTAIIVISSAIYWYLYEMFTWTLVLAVVLISLSTYVITGLLGYMVGLNIDHAIAISICSTCKNSGVSFAVLVMAFDAPDNYIAFVPSLALVLSTSFLMYTVLTIRRIRLCWRRRGQPEVIQAGQPKGDDYCDARRLSNESSKSCDKSLVNNDEFLNLSKTPHETAI